MRERVLNPKAADSAKAEITGQKRQCLTRYPMKQLLNVMDWMVYPRFYQIHRRGALERIGIALFRQTNQ